MIGAILGRAAPQVRRLALVYAVLDCSPVVTRNHLEGALEVWRYCEESAAWIFGDATGDSTADEILRSLRCSPDGLTLTEVGDLFARHKRAGEIERALGVLLAANLARSEKLDTAGRPVTRWYALRSKRDKREKVGAA